MAYVVFSDVFLLNMTLPQSLLEVGTNPGTHVSVKKQLQ